MTVTGDVIYPNIGKQNATCSTYKQRFQTGKISPKLCQNSEFKKKNELSNFKSRSSKWLKWAAYNWPSPYTNLVGNVRNHVFRGDGNVSKLSDHIKERIKNLVGSIRFTTKNIWTQFYKVNEQVLVFSSSKVKIKRTEHANHKTNW